MSYLGAIALQGAIYEELRTDPRVHALVGDAVFDAMPVTPPAGTYVSLGPGVTRDASDQTGRGAEHDFVVSILSGSDQDNDGFRSVKAAAEAVALALEAVSVPLAKGRLVGLWFQRATARRAEAGAARRVDLTYRARIDLG